MVFTHLNTCHIDGCKMPFASVKPLFPTSRSTSSTTSYAVAGSNTDYCAPNATVATTIIWLPSPVNGEAYALNIIVHLHMILLDGMYTEQDR